MIIGFKNKLITKRSLLGTLFLLIFIGEPAAGYKTGLFTPSGAIAFFLLYFSLFHLLESLISKYKLVVFQVVLLSFALYSVLITGLLNKELTEYVLQPNPFITLIRIQASFFAVFAFYLLNWLLPRNEKSVLSFKQALLFFIMVISLVSFSGVWGIPSLIYTLKLVPLLSAIFILLGITAFFLAIKTKSIPVFYRSKKMTVLCYLYLLLGSMPNKGAFILLLFSMILGGIYLLINRNLRNYPM